MGFEDSVERRKGWVESDSFPRRWVFKALLLRVSGLEASVCF